MYIKTDQKNTQAIIIREMDGDRLQNPIRVSFSDKGVARVKEGVGEYFADSDRFPTVTIHKDESRDSDNQEG